MSGVFPLVFAGDEARLLTAIVLGFLFGFSLERAGFGNARKLAAQFYLTDMTVFKVMFTAILVAMTGLYALVGMGWVDMTRMWVNPTFMGAQVAGGFLLGVGFIMSGLCPGTSVVAAASGRWDGLVTLAGIFLGTAIFAVAIDVVPGVAALYVSGDMGESVLPALLGVPALPFAAAVVVLAAAAFAGAEAVERRFGAGRPGIEGTPPSRRRPKLILAGALLAVVAAGLGLSPAPAPAPVAKLAAIEPLEVAERIIAADPDLLVLDLRAARDDAFPRAFVAALDSTAIPLLAGAGPTADVVLLDDAGTLAAVPVAWPVRTYRVLRGGWAAWQGEIMEVGSACPTPGDDGAEISRRAALAAFFSGTAAVAPAGPPPVLPAAGAGGAKPKRGGC